MVFLPGQIFVFGGFALWANSLGHLEQIESYAPGHQVRFGYLNYTADIRGDLIFDVFEPVSGAPHSHDEHDLALPPDSVREITPVATPALDPEQIESYTPGHQVRFGNLNYTTDIRGDLTSTDSNPCQVHRTIMTSMT